MKKISSLLLVVLLACNLNACSYGEKITVDNSQVQDLIGTNTIELSVAGLFDVAMSFKDKIATSEFVKELDYKIIEEVVKDLDTTLRDSIKTYDGRHKKLDSKDTTKIMSEDTDEAIVELLTTKSGKMYVYFKDFDKTYIIEGENIINWMYKMMEKASGMKLQQY